MNGYLFFLAVDIANIACVALLGARVMTVLPMARNAQLIALISLCTVCHIVLGRYDYGRWVPAAYRIDVGGWEPALNLMRNATPGLFMILVHRLFADRRAVPAGLLALFGLQLLLEALPGNAHFSRALTQVAPTLLQMVFAGFALYWTIENWRIDLVEARRRARAFVAILLGVDVVASSLLLRVVVPPDTLANYQAHLALSLFNLGIAAFLVLWLARENPGPYLGAEPKPARSAKPSPDDDALARLRTLLEKERIWRQPGLSLKLLAGRVGLPEYRLRTLIHERLGQRNFNSFLHQYRIREACALLADPKMRRTPILTIALSVGYQSVNTFNRGFREVTGMTPSAWRAEGGTADGILSPKPE